MRGSSELEFCIIVHLVHLQSSLLMSYVSSVLSIRPFKVNSKKMQIQRRYLIGSLIQNDFFFFFSGIRKCVSHSCVLEYVLLFFKWCICASGLFWSVTSVYLRYQSILHIFEFKLCCVKLTVVHWSSSCRGPRNGPLSATAACAHGHLPSLWARLETLAGDSSQGEHGDTGEQPTDEVPDTDGCLVKLLKGVWQCALCPIAMYAIYKCRC